MQYAVYALYVILFLTAAYVLTHPPKGPPDAVAQELSVPKIESGTPVRWVFGTDIVKQTQVLDYMNPRTTPIKTKSGK